MKYSITVLPKYQTKLLGKYDNWNNLNRLELGFSSSVNIVNCNYQVYYK
jgi:hypothetical protein